MAISPVGFVTAPPIQAVDAVQRVRRRPKSKSKSDADGAGRAGPAPVPSYAAATAEEIASDATQEALQNIRLGG